MGEFLRSVFSKFNSDRKMLSCSSRVASVAVKANRMVSVRHLGAAAPAAQKASDPIQQLFVDKVREYAQKKTKAGGKLVDATPKVEADLQKELDKVSAQFGGGKGVDMTKFPQFKFAEPTLETV